MVNRQSRDPGALRRFDEQARIGDAPSYAVDTGDAWRVLSSAAGSLSARLGKLADDAAAREGENAGLASGASSGAAYLQLQAAQKAAGGKAGASWRDAIALIESRGSGDYSAVGPRNSKMGRALGRYQIMEANVGPWSREALGRSVSVEEFMRDRSIQDAVFDHKFGGYVQRFGLEGAAQAWFAGPGGVGKTGRSDVLGTNVGSYGQRFIAALGKTSPETGGDAPALPVLSTTPLALRRDGTVYGEAYDRAASNAYAWRLQTGLETQMQAAYEANQDDPGALAGSLEKVHGEFAKDPNLQDPQMQEAFAKRFAERSQAFMLDAQSKAAAKMRQDEQAAAFEGIAAQRQGVERQGIALGANPKADEIMAREVERSGRAIDGAVSSGALTPAQGRKAKADLAETAATARVRGVYEALDTPDKKEAFAVGLLEEWTAGKGPLAKLPYDTVKSLSVTLWNDARAEINRRTASQKVEAARTEQLIDDDVTSIETTGKALDPKASGLTPETVSAQLGREKFDAWRIRREAAQQTWQATSGMETQTAADITARLTVLKPKPGTAGFEQAQKVFDLATKKATAVLKARVDDPAVAVDASFPNVKQLVDQANPQDPDSMQAMVSARLQAQKSLGLDDFTRSPLTNQEALSLARAVTAQPDPSLQQKAMGELVTQVQAVYGPHANAVLAQVLQVRGVDKEMSQFGAGLFARLSRGDAPTRTDRRQGGVLSETAVADRAGQPAGSDAWPLPNYKQQQMLLSSPELATQFDQKFGPGASARILGQRQKGTDRPVSGGTATVDDKGEGFIPDGR